MMRYIFRLLILFGLVSGCGSAPTSMPGVASSSTETPELILTPTATSTASSDTPTPTHLPNAIPTDQLDRSVFRFYENNPVLQHSNNPRWDNLYIDPGAMVYQDSMFHMFFNGINGFPAPVGVGYATSPDGYHWTRQVSEPVLSATSLKNAHLLGTNLFVTSVLIESNGTWVLYFYTLSGNTFFGPGEIGRATAPAPTGPWAIDADPVLSPGPSGSWDDIQVSAPDVLKTENGYKMYYDALGKDSTSMIGMATSGSRKFAPGEFAFGAASSPDGVSWTKSSLNPILSNKDHSQWSQAFLASLLYVDGTYFLYFDFVTPIMSGTNVYLVTYKGLLK